MYPLIVLYVSEEIPGKENRPFDLTCVYFSRITNKSEMCYNEQVICTSELDDNVHFTPFDQRESQIVLKHINTLLSQQKKMKINSSGLLSAP